MSMVNKVEENQKEILIIEIGAQNSSKFAESLWTSLQAKGVKLEHITNFTRLEEYANSVGEPRAIIYHWNSCNPPHVHMELILQNPVLSGAPFVLFASEAQPQDVAFWEEYHLKYLVRNSNNLDRDIKLTMKLVTDDELGLTKLSIECREYRNFFSLLHKRMFDEATELLKSRLELHLNKYEIIYLKGHIYKVKKQFDQAIMQLGIGLNMARGEGRTLEPRYLHLIGNSAFKAKDNAKAWQFLEAAHRISPRNARRQLLLGMLSMQLQNYSDAIKYLQELYEECREYNPVYSPLIEVIIHQATDHNDLKLLPSLLTHISERRLHSMVNRIKLKNHHLYNDLIYIFRDQFYRHAENAVTRDDFYGAVGIYQYVRRLLRSYDIEGRFEVNLRIAEALLESHDKSLALKHLDGIKELFSQANAEQQKRFTIALGNAAQSLPKPVNQ